MINKKILVIDSQEEVRNSIAISLEESILEGSEYAYQVDGISQGLDGFQMIKRANQISARYSIAFISSRMLSGWSGIKTVQTIRKVTNSLRIVLLTSYLDEDSEDIYSRLHNIENLLFFKKPFSQRDIVQIVSKLIYLDEVENKYSNVIESSGELQTTYSSGVDSWSVLWDKKKNIKTF